MSAREMTAAEMIVKRKNRFDPLRNCHKSLSFAQLSRRCSFVFLIAYSCTDKSLDSSLFSSVLIETLLMNLVDNSINAGAKNIFLTAERRNGKVIFSVKDDGCGFDPATRLGSDEGHFGLQGVQERIESIGGKVTIVSAPGSGTKISASITMAKEGRQ